MNAANLIEERTKDYADLCARVTVLETELRRHILMSQDRFIRIEDATWIAQDEFKNFKVRSLDEEIEK